jgi:hypothetical protein
MADIKKIVSENKEFVIALIISIIILLACIGMVVTGHVNFNSDNSGLLLGAGYVLGVCSLIGVAVSGGVLIKEIVKNSKPSVKEEKQE